MKITTGMVAMIVTILAVMGIAASAVANQGDEEISWTWFDSQEVEDPEKVWTVAFSQDVDPDSVEGEIYIEKEGERLPKERFDIGFIDGGQSVTITSHEEYVIGEVYTLAVGDGVRSSQGALISEAVKMPFTLMVFVMTGFM
ncbi:hypothetical protein [Salisediminibacterium selenitireducens]|uniref:SbsA Ig-like domain-containing protein n=1 Tax=Bacillus selenitireducens (strain ATCC 700615 / DSM 15326 / MLS10) TaxID=439292 RepID=D6XZH4_BACIE|nr:hypothetical protein [Salisediminibacterium selenitireducens]ADH98348.1 hypothetical protein Bsel_0820 [[Bacillus] selenitireducens MLS10]